MAYFLPGRNERFVMAREFSNSPLRQTIGNRSVFFSSLSLSISF